MKISRRTVILTSIITILPIFMGIALWNQFPEVMATHFGVNNEPNGWTSKAATVFGIPVVLLALQLICVFATVKNPGKTFGSKKLLNIVLWIIPVTSVLVLGMIYMYNMEMAIDARMICLSIVGILFTILGNYLPKCRKNYVVGIRLPWTLADEENWNYTHRIGGFTFVICGLVLLASGFFFHPVVAIGTLVIAVLVPSVASFLYYKKNGISKEEE